jgi:hypothetical protein
MGAAVSIRLCLSSTHSRQIRPFKIARQWRREAENRQKRHKRQGFAGAGGRVLRAGIAAAARLGGWGKAKRRPSGDDLGRCPSHPAAIFGMHDSLKQ